MFEIEYTGQALEHYHTLPSDQRRRLTKHIQRAFYAANKPKSHWKRALGKHDPPNTIEIDNQTYTLRRVFKHEFWSATALYVNHHRTIMCRFNREVSLMGLPLQWIGKFLARRERHILQQLRDSAYFPKYLGTIKINGAASQTAVPFTYAYAWPLNYFTCIELSTAQELTEALEALHHHYMAHADIHARNILIDEDQKPIIIDLQTCLRLPNNWLGKLGITQKLLKKLQLNDLYRLEKQLNRFNVNDRQKTAKYASQSHSKFLSIYRAIKQAIKNRRKKRRIKEKLTSSLPKQLAQGSLVVDEYQIEYQYEGPSCKLRITSIRHWKP